MPSDFAPWPLCALWWIFSSPPTKKLRTCAKKTIWLQLWQSSTAPMLRNPSNLSFRGAEGDEESRPDLIGVSRARFLSRGCGIGMTASAGFFGKMPEEVRACQVC
jgi:hypothetical protein